MNLQIQIISIAIAVIFASVIIVITRQQRLKNEKFSARCGHMTTRYGVIISIENGVSSPIRHILPLHEGVPDWCHKCRQNMIITCAWCENSIHPSDGISLHMLGAVTISPPPDSRVYRPNGETVEWAQIGHEGVVSKDTRLVGCMRHSCRDNHDRDAHDKNFVGHWVPPGKVELFRSLTDSSDKELTAVA